MEKAIEIKNISFRYDEKEVLKDISLDIQKQEFVAFVGPNGSGKSTLMKLVLGILKQQHGQIKILGTSNEYFKDWTRIGYISQDVKNFNPGFPATVGEIIATNLYSRMGFFKILNKKLEKKIDTALNLVEMEEFKKRKLGNLSGGQQQRIFIARTLVNDPDIIFLDEPLVGVDGEAQDNFFKLINRLNREMGITIVMISHDIHVISTEASKVVCFANKKIFVHDADSFNYHNYQQDLREGNKIIPEHEHMDGE